MFKKAAAKAKLPDSTTTHDLRHHFASVLLASGQSVVAVAELLGHENATLVLTTYGHLLPGGEELARKAIDGAWNVAPDRAVTAQGGPDDVDTGSGAGQARLPVDAGLFSLNRYVFLATVT